VHRFFIWGCILAVLGVSSWWLRVVTAPREQDASELLPGTELALLNAHYREVGLNGLRMEARAERSTYEQASNLALAERLRVRIFQNDSVTEVIARRGAYDVVGEVAVLMGGVRVLNERGYTLATTSATYRRREALIYTDHVFQAEGNGVTLQGMGLRYDLKEEAFTVEKNVDARISGIKL
jgi:LPS export ABC transporter protein LptC